MQRPKISSALFIKNREKIRELMLPDSALILFSSDQMPRSNDQFYKYRQNSDFFYLTGIGQPKSIFIMCPHHHNEKFREVLIIQPASPEDEVWNGKKLSPEEAFKISGISSIRLSEDYAECINEIFPRLANVYYLSSESTKYPALWEDSNTRLLKPIREKFPNHAFHQVNHLTGRLRMTKEPEEIELIRHACAISLKAFQRLKEFVKPGVMEYEIEAEIIHEFIKSGATGYAYDPIIASGKNALVLHYISNSCECKSGDLLLMDFGAEYLNYASDMTRTIPVNGVFTQRQAAIYEACQRVFQQAVSLMKPGILLTDLNQKVGEAWEGEHVKLGLYTREQASRQDNNIPLWKKYFMHGTSHSIGLDVHDVFDKSLPLAPGMVLSCEPGIYIPEEGMGIRLEDVILITKNGCENLMETENEKNSI